MREVGMAPRGDHVPANFAGWTGSIRKLKPGPTLPRDVVIADQRRRLQDSIVSVVDERGWRGVRVRPLVKTAGVSTASFYRQFADADECLASACEVTMATAIRDSGAGQRRGADWHASLEAVVTAFLGALAARPQASRVALIDVFSAGPSARRGIPRGFAGLESVLARSFETAPDPPPVPRHLLAGMTAGMLRVARREKGIRLYAARELAIRNAGGMAWASFSS